MKQNKAATPRSRKISKDTIVSSMRTDSRVPRKVTITLPKSQLEPGEVWPYMGITIQSALRELGVAIDITIRENENEFEVVAEE
jgi:hypothetical protein